MNIDYSKFTDSIYSEPRDSQTTTISKQNSYDFDGTISLYSKWALSLYFKDSLRVNSTVSDKNYKLNDSLPSRCTSPTDQDSNSSEFSNVQKNFNHKIDQSISVNTSISSLVNEKSRNNFNVNNRQRIDSDCSSEDKYPIIKVCRQLID